MDTLEELYPTLRLKIGDITPASYRYLDEWLLVALTSAVKSLERYWGSKYLVTDEGVISRNSLYLDFEFEEDDGGIIQRKDEDIIIIKAALMILEGSLENSAWDVGSWKDAEIAYSNISSGKLREGILKNLKAELDSLIKSPSKRLTRGSRSSILSKWY